MFSSLKDVEQPEKTEHVPETRQCKCVLASAALYKDSGELVGIFNIHEFTGCTGYTAFISQGYYWLFIDSTGERREIRPQPAR